MTFEDLKHLADQQEHVTFLDGNLAGGTFRVVAVTRCGGDGCDLPKGGPCAGVVTLEPEDDRPTGWVHLGADCRLVQP